ncbi:MAG: pyruvate kinase [Chlorobiales bacterium]|jgi:pyruvate kinase|nr:pyruvate kinase [Chlorobiales bacterium]
MKRTKIICTLGPSTSTLEQIIALIENGMDVARLNFSHGTHDEQKQRIELVREASRQTGKPIAILQDLQGPKIRIGELIKNVLLNPGDKLRITTEDIIGDYDVVSTSYKEIVNDVQPGDTILVDDGRIELKVLSKTKTDVDTQIVIGGILKPHKGLNLPGVRMSVPSLSEKDQRDLEFGLENGVDMVALSFVRSENDILDLKERIRTRARQPWIIAKIEKPEAIGCIDEIIVEADGIMVARGDLGVEMKTAEVPVLQKRIVEKCNRLRKPVIIATQMLESMIENPRPTRAEANDVANAVFDGTDAVMLSGETAAGEYPVEAVNTMREIIERVEAEMLSPNSTKMGAAHQPEHPNFRCIDIDEAVASSSVQIAESLAAKAIVVLTHSGMTAIKVSKQKPSCPVIAMTDSEIVQKWMSLVWGVQSLVTKTMQSTDTCFQIMEELLIENGLVSAGDTIVYTMGIPVLEHGRTDTIKVARIDEESRFYAGKKRSEGSV